MTGQEREAARLGMEALDQALIGLGRPPVEENPDFRMSEPVRGDLPNAVLDKLGVAPIRLIFGPDLDVWVGPFSEVVLLEVSEATKGLIVHNLKKILRSTIVCQAGRRSVLITLAIPGAAPWLRLKVRGTSVSDSLEPSYEPYSRPTE